MRVVMGRAKLGRYADSTMIVSGSGVSGSGLERRLSTCMSSLVAICTVLLVFVQ
jgi:hypothetical protein